jgi:uncharacterized protein (DUF885 family)
MTFFWYILIAIILALLAWFVISLVWGKPWSVNLHYARTFLRFAFDSPELLTHLGLLEKLGFHGHNAKLADASIAHETKEFRQIAKDLRILRSYDRRRQSKAQLLSTDIMDWFLDNQMRAEPFRFHDYPLNQMFGIQSELPNFMLTLHPLVSRTEARNYVRRLSKFGIKFDQVLEGLKMREQKGVLPPRFVIRRVLDEMTAFVGQPATQNPLYTVFKEKTARLKLAISEQQCLLGEVEAQINTVVYPAYQKFIAYFTILEAKATDDDGVWKLPDGAAFYAHCLRSNTTVELNAEQVHAVGLAEVARIEGEMKAILTQLGYEQIENAPRKLQEFAKEERFLYPNTDEGRAQALADYQRILDDINASLDPLFAVRPKAALKVERVPEFREKTSAGAYYHPADLGGGRPGVFYANLRDMNEVAKFGMKTLSYHEGIPGHHFQLAIAAELRGVPFFRRLVPFTAYAEGWALYTEKLVRESGFYKDDPYSELGCLDAELLRAVRLVVDTGIHAMRWTRQQAIDTMQGHTAQALESVISEVERYIVMPGQACAYKIGELKMLELRDKARQALGDKFDLRQFHNVILKNGSMPLSLLEQVVEEYIQGVVPGV